MSRVWKTGFVLVLLVALFSWRGATPSQARDYAGAVYTLTNQTAENAVAIFNRAGDGTLEPAGMVATGGQGTGAGLGSQGGLVLSDDKRWLLAVNAGSNDISVFAASNEGLWLVDKVPSGGTQPISLAVHKHLVYVLNAGGSGNITGFMLDDSGKLSHLAESTRPLSNAGSGSAPGPAQVSFSTDGRVLVVTEKATNKIDTYTLNDYGLFDGPAVHNSVGTTPFGFAFGKDNIFVVSEASGGPEPGLSSASSYRVADSGDLTTITGSSPTHQAAACWVAVTDNGHYAYTVNAGSGSISGYRINQDGTLTLLTADGRTGAIGNGSHPIDAALSNGSRYLYTLDSGIGSISGFRVRSDGSLEAVGNVGGLPAAASGLAAR